MPNDGPKPVARLATAADAAQVVRLACVMFMSMGQPEPDAEWKAMAGARFAERVGNDVIAAVVDHPTDLGTLIASATAGLSTNLPTPANPSGAYAYVQWVATDDAFRFRGYARAVMTTILESLDARGGEVALHATSMGEPLYRSLGFWEGSGAPALRRRSWDPAPGPT